MCPRFPQFSSVSFTPFPISNQLYSQAPFLSSPSFLFFHYLKTPVGKGRSIEACRDHKKQRYLQRTYHFRGKEGFPSFSSTHPFSPFPSLSLSLQSFPKTHSPSLFYNLLSGDEARCLCWSVRKEHEWLFHLNPHKIGHHDVRENKDMTFTSTNLPSIHAQTQAGKKGPRAYEQHTCKLFWVRELGAKEEQGKAGEREHAHKIEVCFPLLPSHNA